MRADFPGLQPSNWGYRMDLKTTAGIGGDGVGDILRNRGLEDGNPHPSQCFSFLCYLQTSPVSGEIGASDMQVNMLWEGGGVLTFFVLPSPTPTPNPSLTHACPAQLRCWWLFSQLPWRCHSPLLWTHNCFLSLKSHLPPTSLHKYNTEATSLSKVLSGYSPKLDQFSPRIVCF